MKMSAGGSTTKAVYPDYNMKDSNVVNINFVCQRCCHPLKIDSSFNSLDDHMYSDLTVLFAGSSDSYSTFPITDQHYGDNDINNKESTEEDMVKVSRKYIPPPKLSGSNNGFMLVRNTSTSSVEDDDLTRINTDKSPTYADIKNMNVIAKLFDIMSDQSDIDHPLCEECADILLNFMDHQLETVENECDDYKEIQLQLQSSEEQEDPEILQEQLQNLCDEEIDLEIKLKQLEEEQKQLEDEEDELKIEQNRIYAEYEHYWKGYCEYKRQALNLIEKHHSMENQLTSARNHLEKLKKTNVFNATFHIWHNGPFGTINSFRLGRLPNVPIEWNEINAAWGQTTLLLHSLAKKFDLEFKKYKLVPYGSHSYIKVLGENSTELHLYGSGGFKFFWDNKIDRGMLAFLDCLQQFKEHVEKIDPSFSLPYQMDKGKIIDPTGTAAYPIKVQFNSEEQWTKALKFMLTNLKWALAWAASH